MKNRIEKAAHFLGEITTQVKTINCHGSLWILKVCTEHDRYKCTFSGKILNLQTGFDSRSWFMELRRTARTLYIVEKLD